MTILRKDLKLWPYKHQRVQQLKPGDHEKRMNFANLMLYESEGLDFDNIIFTDEAHFYLHGFINRQNNRTWALDNPHVIMETPCTPKGSQYGLDWPHGESSVLFTSRRR